MQDHEIILSYVTRSFEQDGTMRFTGEWESKTTEEDTISWERELLCDGSPVPILITLCMDPQDGFEPYEDEDIGVDFIARIGDLVLCDMLLFWTGQDLIGYVWKPFSDFACVFLETSLSLGDKINPIRSVNA